MRALALAADAEAELALNEEERQKHLSQFPDEADAWNLFHDMEKREIETAAKRDPLFWWNKS